MWFILGLFFSNTFLISVLNTAATPPQHLPKHMLVEPPSHLPATSASPQAAQPKCFRTVWRGCGGDVKELFKHQCV